MTLDIAYDWMGRHDGKAQAIAERIAREDLGEIATDDLDCLGETGLRTGMSGSQRRRVLRIVEAFVAEAESEAGRDSREAYEELLAKF